MDTRDVVTIAALFMLALYVWSLPFQDNNLPFGEGDSAWHFSIGDYMAQHDVLISSLPFYVSQWYYNFNKLLGPGALEYTPANHVNYALMQALSTERFTPVSVFRAFASFLGVFSTYFLLRRLYGFLPALLASFGLVFSLKEYMIYLWGQQPTLVSFVIVPVFLYALYRYVLSLFENRPSSVYLAMAVFLLLSQYFLHVQGLIVSALSSLFFVAFMAVRHRKVPFTRKTLVQLGIGAGVFLALAAPFALIYLGADSPVKPSPRDFSRFLDWNVPHELVSGSFPPAFVSFRAAYGGLWLLPLMLLGAAVLLLRRQPRDLLILGWLAALYVTLHLDVIMGSDSLAGRVARMGVAEPPVLFSLMALGALSVPSFLPLPRMQKIAARYAIVVLVAVFLAFTIGAQAVDTLSSSYGGISRLTPAQLAAAEWMNANIPEDALLYAAGTFSYPKARWMLASSQRHVELFRGSFSNESRWEDSPYYLIMDYSDLSALANSQYRDSALAQIQQLQQAEQQLFGNVSPLYENYNIRVYHVEKTALN